MSTAAHSVCSTKSITSLSALSRKPLFRGRYFKRARRIGTSQKGSPLNGGKSISKTPGSTWALHGAVSESLLARVSSGEASSSEFDVAIKFLKNNGITSEYNPHASAAMKFLQEALNLPFRGGDPEANTDKESNE